MKKYKEKTWLKKFLKEHTVSETARNQNVHVNTIRHFRDKFGLTAKQFVPQQKLALGANSKDQLQKNSKKRTQKVPAKKKKTKKQPPKKKQTKAKKGD